MWMLDSVIFLPSAGTDTRLLKTPPLRHTVVCCTHFTALAHLSFLLLAAPLHMQAKWLRCPHLVHLLSVAGHVFLLTSAPFQHLVNDGQACDCEGSAVGLRPLFLMLNRHGVQTHFNSGLLSYSSLFIIWLPSLAISKALTVSLTDFNFPFFIMVSFLSSTLLFWLQSSWWLHYPLPWGNQNEVLALCISSG